MPEQVEERGRVLEISQLGYGRPVQHLMAAGEASNRRPPGEVSRGHHVAERAHAATSSGHSGFPNRLVAAVTHGCGFEAL